MSSLNSKITPSGPWLDLSEAARYLGVHFTTLRRWADAGEIPCIRTPGGRRRFALSDLQQFLERLRQPSTKRFPEFSESNALEMARRHIQAHSIYQERWFARLGEGERLHFKRSGQRLFGLLLQYSTRSDAGRVFLEEAKRTAQEYGVICYQAGLSITDTVKALLFFRRSLVDAVFEAASLNSPHDIESQRLYRRMSDFFDTILLDIVQSYCDIQVQNASQSRKGQ